VLPRARFAVSQASERAPGKMTPELAFADYMLRPTEHEAHSPTAPARLVARRGRRAVPSVSAPPPVLNVRRNLDPRRAG